MKNILGKYVNRYEKKHKDFRHYVVIVAVLALIVFVGVNWRLHDKGISMTSDYQCGLKEHKHTEECYKKVLICGKEETDGSEGHTHTDACYEEKKKLTCDKEEHKHNADCYDEDGNLICDKEEHEHSEDCYTTEKELVCGKKESEPVEAHHHTDACYKKELVCGLEEHTHTAACYSNESADVEDKSDWEATIPELSGNWAEDIVAVAQSQLGYEESTANFKLADDGETRQGYTRYGAWYGNKYGDWSAMFASFCLNYAGIPAETVPVNSGCTAWITELKGQKLYKAANDYKPVEGDLVFLDTDNDDQADHVGIITEVEKEDGKITSVKAIVGDSSDKVEENTYEADGTDEDVIMGYCALPENPDEKKADEVDTEVDTTEAESTTAATAEEKTEAEVTTETKATSEADATTEKAGATTEKSEEKTESTKATTAESKTEEEKSSETTTEAKGSGESTEESIASQTAEAETTAKTATQKALKSKSRVAVQDADNSIDFKQYITSATMQHKANEWQNWEEIGENGSISENDWVQVSLAYEIPGGTLSSGKNTITYELPAALKDFTGSGEVTNSAGQIVGSYNIENGVVSISFNDDFVKANADGSEISGWLKFSSKAETINTDDNNKVDIIFNEKNEINLEIKQSEEKKGDITVTKKATQVNQEDGTIQYEVVVKSTNGTSSTVTLDDVMTNLGIDGDIKVEKQGQTITDGITITKNSDNKGFSVTLPQMNENEEYKLTYTAKLPDNLKGTNTTAKNKIVAKSTNSDNKEISSEAEVKTEFKPLLKKDGTSKGDGIVEWKITVNEEGKDIGGWTLSDKLNGEDLSGKEVTVEPAINGSTTITLPYTFPDNCHEKYTITYTTEHNHDGWQTVTNKATLTKGDESVSEDKGVNVEGKKNSYTKTGTGIQLNEDGKTMTLNWNVNFSVAKDTDAGWVFTDTPQNNQYFTPDQIKALKQQLDEVLGKDNYTLSNNENKSESENWTNIKVTGKTALKSGQNISFSYQTTATVPEQKTTFSNNAFFNNQWFGGNNTYNPDDYIVVRKVDDNNENGGSNTSHDYNDNNIKGVLRWKILVNFNDAVKQNEKIIVTEHLPDGVSLKSLSYWDQAFNWNGNSGTCSLWINNHSVNITATKDSNNNIIIEIPQEVYKDTNTSQIAFKVSVTLDNADNLDWSQAKQYKNTVTVTNENNKELGTDDQTQTITNNSKTELVKKDGGIVGNTNTIAYSVVVNKEGKDLLQDGEGGTLTLKDELKYTHDPYYGKAQISLVPDSVKVYKYNADGTKGDLLGKNEYSYTYTETGVRTGKDNGDDYGEDRTNTLLITIPDNTAVIVEYSYKVDGVVGTWIKPSNTATLMGKGSKQDDDQNNQNIQIKESSAGADITGINVYKVDSNDYGTYLAGAKFMLYKWDTETNAWIIDTTYNELVSDKTGRVDLGKLVHNQAYKLVEVTPPDGYAMTDGAQNGYLFYIADSDTSKYPVRKPEGFSGTTLSEGQTLYYPNTRSEDYTLPETGGSGTLPFITGGAFLMGFALLSGYSMRRRRGRRVE